MTTVQMSRGTYPIFVAVLVISIAFFEYSGVVKEQGALLITLTFWTALLQGAVAAAAVADLTNSRWIGSLRRELLSAYPLLLVPPLLFLLLAPLFGVYPWTEAPGKWLNETFFLLRNLALLLAAYGTGRLYARRSLRGDPQTPRYAVIYLFAFVTCQTLVAFDWVMSLEYPWISSLLGAFYFVEALYAGLALAGLVFLFRSGSPDRATPSGKHLEDIGLLLFGFSILWAGLFFAQYLLLWYGNLPEEVQFITRRITVSPFRELGVAFLLANFGAPFLLLLSRRAKRSSTMVGIAAAAVLSGIFAERMFFILPVVPMSVGVLLVENFLLLAFWMLTVHSREELLPVRLENPEV
jgi:hypothetical protein